MKLLPGIAIVLLLSVPAKAQIITTIAGELHADGYTGDGVQATATELSGPFSALPDNHGNVYIADNNNHRIRMVDTFGIITTVAGNGSAFHSGDGGPAFDAGLPYPIGVALDAAGNLYIAENVNDISTTGSWVRKVNTAGIITTIAGSGVYGFTGDGGPATAAEFQHLADIAVDGSGNIYVSELSSNRIRKINTAGIITTIAGKGSTGFSGDGGPAITAELYEPQGIAVDNAGNVYICDAVNNRIRKVSTGGIITTIAGNGGTHDSGDGGPATAAAVYDPLGVAVDDTGNLYIAEWDAARVRKVNTAGIITTIAGTGFFGYSGDGGPATAAEMEEPTRVSIDKLGDIYIPDIGNDNVREIVVCPVIPPITGPDALCLGYSITLTDNTTGGIWGSSNPNATVSGGVVTGVAPGADTITYTVKNICGTTVLKHPVTIDATIPGAGNITGADSLCSGQIITLTDTTATIAGAWSSGNTAIAVIIGSGIVTGISAGASLISYVVTNGCGSSVATKALTVNPLPDAGTIGGPPSICKDAIFILSETVNGGAWTSSNAAVASVDNNTGTLTSLGYGSATITYSISPDVLGCANKAIFPITVAPLLIIGDVEQITCYGNNNGAIATSVSGGTGPYQYTWTGGYSSSDVHNLTPGSYLLLLKDTKTLCTAVDSFSITQPDSLQIVPDVVNDACDLKKGSISTTISGGIAPYSYMWSNNETTDNLKGLSGGTYSLTLTDINNCKKNFSVVVEEDTCQAIVVHDVITPNGDGINDYWIIEGLQDYPKNSVQVLDKWGNSVFEQYGYNNSWQGRGSNGEIPDGTYFYLVKLNAVNLAGGKNVFTGSILIKR